MAMRGFRSWEALISPPTVVLQGFGGLLVGPAAATLITGLTCGGQSLLPAGRLPSPGRELMKEEDMGE